MSDVLAQASADGYTCKVGRLLKDGAQDYGDALLEASKAGHAFVCRLILQQMQQQQQNGGWQDAMCKAMREAVRFGHVHVCRHLLDAGASVEAADAGTGFTDLILSIQKGHDQVARLLLERGARLDQESEEGITALDFARHTNEILAQKLKLYSNALQKRVEDGSASSPGYWSRFEEDFEVLDILGSGAFGKVFRAKYKLTNVELAVKEIRIPGDVDETTVRNAYLEAEVLSGLKHKNIIEYVNVWWEENPMVQVIKSPEFKKHKPGDLKIYSNHHVYIVTELCRKDTLKSCLDAGLLLDKSDQLSVCQQISSALTYIHSRYKTHRDLKPDNIFFSLANQVKVGDFGLAALVKIQDGQSVKRKEKTGHPLYCSPEQTAQKFYGRRTDIFSLGLIFHEILSSVYKGRAERLAALERLRDGEPVLDEIKKDHPEESDLIKKMVAQKEADRPFASEVEDEVTRLLKLEMKSKSVRKLKG